MKKFTLFWSNLLDWLTQLTADSPLHIDEEGLPTQRNRYYS